MISRSYCEPINAIRLKLTIFLNFPHISKRSKKLTPHPLSERLSMRPIDSYETNIENVSSIPINFWIRLFSFEIMWKTKCIRTMLQLPSTCQNRQVDMAAKVSNICDLMSSLTNIHPGMNRDGNKLRTRTNHPHPKAKIESRPRSETSRDLKSTSVRNRSVISTNVIEGGQNVVASLVPLDWSISRRLKIDGKSPINTWSIRRSTRGRPSSSSRTASSPYN